MAETAFDPSALGDVPVEQEFDPSSLGDVAVDNFDPASLGDTPVEETPIQGSNLSSVGLASASRGILQGVTGAIRTASTIYPQFRGLADTIAESTGIPTTEEFLTELEGAASRASDDYGVDPKQKGLLVDLASGAGSLLPTVASGPFAPFTTAAMMGEQGLQESREAGASPTQQATTFLGNAATGFVTEKLLGLPALLKSAQKAKLPEKTLRALIGSVTKQVGLSFVREGTQESLEQLSQDTIAKYIAAYDPDRKVFDGKKLLKTALVGGLLGGPVGGLVQLATDLDSSKAQNQIEAEQVDQTIAQAATIQPPPLPTNAQAIRSDAGQVPTAGTIPQKRPVQGSGDLQQPPPREPSGTEVPQPEVPAKVDAETLGNTLAQTAIKAEQEGRRLTPEEREQRKTFAKALRSEVEEGDTIEIEEETIDKDGNKGTKIVRYKAYSEGGRLVAQEVDENGRDVDGGRSFGLEEDTSIPFHNALLSSVERGVTLGRKFLGIKKRSAKGKSEAGFVGTAIRTPTGSVSGESPGSAHMELIDQALSEGSEVKESDLGFAFRKPDGTTEWVDRVEAGRRLTESGQITGLKPGEKLTSEHIRNEVPGVTFNATPKSTGVIDANQAAETLQPFFSEAVEVARKAGAQDPEAAASQAQIELSNQVEQGKTTLDNPKSLFMEAARRQAGKQKVVEQTTEPEPVTTRGPRAETISDEDTRSIDTAINRLPETQKNIIQKLTEDPTLTDQDIADELGLTIDQVKKGKSAARKTLQSFIQEQGIGLSMGPGAASAAEVLVRYEERKFGKRFQETQEIDPEIQRTTGDRYYEPIPNRVTAQKATELIDQNGVDAVESEIRDDKSSLSYADRSTVGQILIKRLNEQYKAIKDKGSTEAKAILNRAAELAEWAADFGTKLGQGVQSFAMWSRLTPEGKLKTFERMVDKKRKDYIRSNRGDIDQIKDIVNGEGTNPQKVEKLRKLKSKTARKLNTRAGKIVQAAKDGKLTDKKFFDAAGDALGLPVFTPEVAAEILRLANDIDAAPEGMPKMDATLKLNKFLAQQKGFDPSDLLFGVYYGNILSGLQTQAVNLVDTTLNVVNEVVNLVVTNPKAALPILRGLARGFGTGKADAMMALMHGRRISDGKFVEDPFLMEVADFGKKGGVPIRSDTMAGRAFKRFAESKLGTPLNLYKYVGRAMAAADAFAFRGAEAAKAAQLAYRIANEQGIATTEHLDQVLGYDRIPEFLKQAESEGYKGQQAKARATELMIMSRPPEIQKAATDFAGEATYNVKPYGIMGAVSNSLEGLSRNVKPLKLVVPFTRIVANVMNRGLNNSPYGYVSAIRGKTFGGKHAREFTTEERNAMLVRATISTTLVAALVALHEAGALTIHGQGPSDPEKKKQLRQSGWKPYTIQIGDTYLNYNLTPIGLFMAATGNWLDNEKYQDFSSKEGLDKLTYSLQSVASTMFNQSFLSGLSTVFDAISGKSPAQQISAGKRFTANTVSSLGVPFNSALKDIEAVFSEPNIPRIDSMRQAMIASIPFASQGLQPQLNALGEPVKSSRSRFINFQNDDPVWKLVYEKGLRVPVPNTFFDAPDDQYEYVKQQGQALRKWMEANLNRLQSMSTEDAQHAIENASDTFRERERNKMIFQGRKKKEKKR